MCDPHRLKKLEDLANEILSSSSTTSATLDQLEGDLTEYERSCTSLPQKEGEERARVIKEKLYVRIYMYMHVHT